MALNPTPDELTSVLEACIDKLNGVNDGIVEPELIKKYKLTLQSLGIAKTALEHAIECLPD